MFSLELGEDESAAEQTVAPKVMASFHCAGWMDCKKLQTGDCEKARNFGPQKNVLTHFDPKKTVVLWERQKRVRSAREQAQADGGAESRQAWSVGNP